MSMNMQSPHAFLFQYMQFLVDPDTCSSIDIDVLFVQGEHDDVMMPVAMLHS